MDGVDLELGAGEIVALVGESGSGKSVTALSVLGLSRSHGTHFGGEIRYGGRNLLDLSENELRSVRGAEIAMVFQDPLTALNPVRKVGWQIEEMLMLHRPISSRRGAPAGGRAAGRGRNPRCREPRRRLPARVLGRHAPAGDDRDGDGLPARGC